MPLLGAFCAALKLLHNCLLLLFLKRIWMFKSLEINVGTTLRRYLIIVDLVHHLLLCLASLLSLLASFVGPI